MVLDQFAGSGVLGEAALKTHRDSILIEKDFETFNKMCERISVLGEVEVISAEQREAINIAIDALEAVHDGPEHMKQFAEYQNSHGTALSEAFHALGEIPTPSTDNALQDALSAASDAIKASDLHREMSCSNAELETRVLECSSRGDRRFSALFAMVTIKGRERSIEEFYQDAKRTADGKKAGKGKPFDHIICPFTGDKLPAAEATNLYEGLWVTYLTKHPELVEFANGFDEFHDMFRGKNTVNCQADVIAAYIKEPDAFTEKVRSSFWYQNMASKKKSSLATQINSAEQKAAEQLNLFSGMGTPPSHWSR